MKACVLTLAISICVAAGPPGAQEDAAALLQRADAYRGGRDSFVSRALVRLADAPLGLQPAAFLEPVQRGVEGAGFHLQQLVRLRGSSGRCRARAADPTATSAG